MTDYFSVFLTGVSTGAGVVVAQKLMRYIDKHPFTNYVKESVKQIQFPIDEEEEEKPRRRT